MTTLAETLGELSLKIALRRGIAGSYSARLLADPTLTAKKVGEEGVEVALAGVLGERERLVEESADLLYHWLVLLVAHDVGLDEVAAELQRRAERG